jgi:hypothetical protein
MADSELVSDKGWLILIAPKPVSERFEAPLDILFILNNLTLILPGEVLVYRGLSRYGNCALRFSLEPGR